MNSTTVFRIVTNFPLFPTHSTPTSQGTRQEQRSSLAKPAHRPDRQTAKPRAHGVDRTEMPVLLGGAGGFQKRNISKLQIVQYGVRMPAIHGHRSYDRHLGLIGEDRELAAAVPLDPMVSEHRVRA